MRIVHIIHRYWPSVGGSEKYFQEVSQRLAAEGHEVCVYTTDAFDIEHFWLRGRRTVAEHAEWYNGVEIRRCRVYHLPMHPRAMRILSWLPSDMCRCLFSPPSPLVPGIWSELRKARGYFDLVHTTALPYTSILHMAIRFAEKDGMPVICTPFMHLGEREDDDVGRHYARPYQIDLLRRCDLIFVQTRTEHEYLMKRGISEDRLCISGVGINPPEVLGGDGDRFRNRYNIKMKMVFYVGAKSYDKGTIHTVEAVRILWRKGFDCALVLAGSTMSDFRRYYEGLPDAVRARILLLDVVSEEEKRDIFAAGDVFVMPSRSDSFGIGYLEAWAYGKPVIGVRAGGVVDVIKDGEDGYLAEFGNVSMLAERIESLIRDGQRAHLLGERGYSKVMARYTWDYRFCTIQRKYRQLSRPSGLSEDIAECDSSFGGE